MSGTEEPEEPDGRGRLSFILVTRRRDTDGTHDNPRKHQPGGPGGGQREDSGCDVPERLRHDPERGQPEQRLIPSGGDGVPASFEGRNKIAGVADRAPGNPAVKRARPAGCASRREGSSDTDDRMST